jgi:hypothetical protein
VSDGHKVKSSRAVIQFSLDGHVIVNTQTEIRIITPTEMVPARWMVLKDFGPTTSFVNEVILGYILL